jgi:hypothetical protein
MIIGRVVGQDLVAVLHCLVMQAKPGLCEAMLPSCLPHPLDSGFLAWYFHADDHGIKIRRLKIVEVDAPPFCGEVGCVQEAKPDNTMAD